MYKKKCYVEIAACLPSYEKTAPSYTFLEELALAQGYTLVVAVGSVRARRNLVVLGPGGIPVDD